MARTKIKKSSCSYFFVGLVVLFFCTALGVPVLASDIVLDLGVLPGSVSSTAFGISGDGSVIVGVSVDTANHDHAFRWTQATGMVDLGTLLGGVNTLAY